MKAHIAIVTWWESKEREISLRSAETIFHNLNKELYNVSIYTLPIDYSSFKDSLHTFNLVIPVIHGIWWENGEVTKICEENNIPVFFTTSDSHQLCIDKYLCTLYLQKHEITVPKTVIIKEENEHFMLQKWEKVFIKPVHWGSSVDSGICYTQEKVDELLAKILHYDEALIQEYVSGQEFTVSVVWNWDWEVNIYAISEIITWEAFFDYDAKYTLKNTQEVTPANIHSELEDKIKHISEDIYRLCKITCLARIDFIYNKDTDMLYFLEVNTIPWFTEASFFPQAIQHRWLSISAFLDKTIKDISIY